MIDAAAATAQVEATALVEVEGDLALHTTATDRDATKATSILILQAAGIRNANARIGTAAETDGQIGSGTVIVVAATVVARATEDAVTTTAADPIGEVVATSLRSAAAVAEEAEKAVAAAEEATTSTRRCVDSGAGPRHPYQQRSANQHPT